MKYQFLNQYYSDTILHIKASNKRQTFKQYVITSNK